MKTINYVFVAAMIIILLITGSCTCDKAETGTDDDTSGTSTNTGVIGTAGGSITTDSGAVIDIPQGALDSEESITITSYERQSNLPESSGIIGNFSGGLTLSPDGLSLNKPVSVTIPLSDTLASGMEVKLFLYDDGDPQNSNYPEHYSGWQQTDFTGTVSPDGQSVVAQIDHFSTYVIQMNFGKDTLDVLGDMVDTMGENGLSVDFHNYQTYFESVIAKIGDMHTYDLPGGFGYDCYMVVGIRYILYHDMGVLFENPLHDFKGTEGEIAFNYNYEKDIFLVLGAAEKKLIYHLFIDVFIDRAPPCINVTAGSTKLQRKEKTTITCSLGCGSDKMKNQTVYFESSDLGTVQPTQQQTNDNGEAAVTFTAGDEEGTAVVTATYEARDKDQTVTITDTVNIKIGELEEWAFTIIYKFDDPDHSLVYKNERFINNTKVNGTFVLGPPKLVEGIPYDIYGEANGTTSQSKQCPTCEDVSHTQTDDYYVLGNIVIDGITTYISVYPEDPSSWFVDFPRTCYHEDGEPWETKWSFTCVPFSILLPFPLTEGIHDGLELYQYSLYGFPTISHLGCPGLDPAKYDSALETYTIELKKL